VGGGNVDQGFGTVQYGVASMIENKSTTTVGRKIANRRFKGEMRDILTAASGGC
jgi:hypothetical protein